ncbi:conserved hypothetical protein [Shewanella denitrificans OS217]|jgi:hypothetical protein|uniref:DUF4381 domain-containing protein n=1 Tax=Shewanella denitrificans (strain OS217 / ATCC BAA-1090 / DSM 15013) TaxID=318161 RepID=Q12P15_SHEDO|nr:DUF4381 domain-containing protein [Shewanella denitrificans]ABE54811.1 conserved hypothetical protein [Shewanella denitrificans OS217]
MKPQTTTDPMLAQLDDIILPQSISDLPLAPGYWLLAFLLILFIGMIVRGLMLKRRYHAPRKAAIALLNSYDITSDEFAAQVNTLLKRTALSYLPREQLAHLNGNEWFDWLDTRMPVKHKGTFGALLVKRHQAQGLTTAEKHALKQLGSTWLSNTSPFSLNNANSQKTGE